jgi:uncharacterized Zn-binding protein involved in type VI secretion
MGLPIACTGDQTNTLYGPPGVIASITTTVLAGGRPVATIGALVSPHGNFTNPQAPGYNPACEAATIAPPCVPNVLVEGRPVAVISPTTMCTCKFHWVALTGDPTILVG